MRSSPVILFPLLFYSSDCLKSLKTNRNNNKYIHRTNHKMTNIKQQINDIEVPDNIELPILPDQAHDPTSILSVMRAEREVKRLELIAADIAITKLEKELKQKHTNETNLIRGSYDYGFSSKSEGATDLTTKTADGSTVPGSAIKLALSNFKRELKCIYEDYIYKPPATNTTTSTIDKYQDEMRNKIKQLTLSNDAVWKRESLRPTVKAPYIIKIPYLFLCLLLDNLFDGKPIDRFYFLETVARMPYFSYITALHAYVRYHCITYYTILYYYTILL